MQELDGYDVRSAIVANRVVLFDKPVKAFRIARLKKNGRGKLFVTTGTTTYRTLQEALKAMAEPIRQHIAKHGLRVASHLYGDAFAVAKESRGEWSHYRAKLTAKGVEVSPHAYRSRGEALTHVHRAGGVVPTLDLASLPARPLGLYS